ncbi:MAG TPA: hypothetical protein VGN25_01055 [Solirubrobacteraceae bacterium]|nr:hypothetical protein [Solirubrobacteraceae bacterium]
MLMTTIAIGLAFMAMGAGGCGSGSHSAPSIRSVSTAAATTPAAGTSRPTGVGIHDPESTLILSSPVKLDPIASRYTCDGANVSLPISWRNVPADTAEIDVVIFNLGAPQGNGEKEAWAVAGLKPSLHGLPSGKLPPGAIVGRDQLDATRYSICPHIGMKTSYVVRVLTRRHRVHVKPGFDSEAFAREILNSSSEDSGLLGFSYIRP